MLPSAYEINTSSNVIQEFRGINRNLRIPEYQFSDMKNLTSDYYPVMSPREPRGFIRTLENTLGLFATDKLCWAAGNRDIDMTGAEITTNNNMYDYVFSNFSGPVCILEDADNKWFYVKHVLLAKDGEITFNISYSGVEGTGKIGTNKVSDQVVDEDLYYMPFSPYGDIQNNDLKIVYSPQEALEYFDTKKYLYFDTAKICEVTDTEKTIVQMGAYICVFPDKLTYNTETEEIKYMEQEYKSTGTVTYSLAKIDATPYDTTKIHTGTSAPSNTTTYPYWYDTSVTPNVLKMWSSTYSMWQPVGTTYIKIECTGIGEKFEKYDAVTISGSDIADLNASMIIYERNDDYIVVTGLLDAQTTQTTELTLKREVPDMDFICESGNRLWGCSSEKHEIYASKLGDPWNWNVFMGLSTDSYAATIGTSGDFTGCISHLNYVLFFKENLIHRVYGTVPSNFQISDVHCRGVQKGSEKSLTLVSETLFYKTRDGVCMYDGSMPQSISSDLSNTLYYDAVGAQLNDKYYISMRDSQDTWYLYVYDAAKGMWHLEDNTHVLWFAYYYGGLYFINDAGEMYIVNNDHEDNAIYPGMPDETMCYPDQFYPGSTATTSIDSSVDWYAESGDIGLETIENKYVSKINIRLFLANGSRAKIYVSYDSSNKWELITTISNTDKKTYIIPIITKRCDHMRIKLEGVGEAKLYSIQKVIERGSDVNATT